MYLYLSTQLKTNGHSIQSYDREIDIQRDLLSKSDHLISFEGRIKWKPEGDTPFDSENPVLFPSFECVAEPAMGIKSEFPRMNRYYLPRKSIYKQEQVHEHEIDGCRTRDVKVQLS